MAREELFTVIGSFQEVMGRKRFIPNSLAHMNAKSQRVPLDVPVACTFTRHKATRSKSQLAYHFVLAGYIADHCGYTVDETHDALMRLKFGTKKVTIAGSQTEVRHSASDASGMSKADMAELIEYDLETCAQLGIRVPTAEELGYVTANPTMR